MTQMIRISLKSGLRTAMFAALLLGAPAAGVAAPASTAPASTELAQAVGALREIGALRANFTQTDAAGQSLKGVLSLKRGGKIRFDYPPQAQMLIVGDGKALTIVDSAVEQVQRWPIGNSPLGALLNPAKDVSRYGKPVPSAPGMINIEVRDGAHPEYGLLTLVFEHKPSAPGGLELLGWVSLDAHGRRTVIRLSGHQYGMALADSLFVFNDPRARYHK